MERIEICCIGHITLDKVVTTRSAVFMAGGTAFYFSNALSRMDVGYRLVTAVASDGMAAVDHLREAGVDVNVLPSAHTVYFENIYGENQDHRTQRVLRTADPFPASELAHLDARIFHLGPLLAGDMPLELIRVLAAKGEISLDAQGFLREVVDLQVKPVDWPEKREALKHISILKTNEAEMAVLTGQTGIRKGAKILAEWGVREVVITLGSLGSVVYSHQRFHDIPAYVPNTSVVDATGCGDTYMAGYLYQRSKGVPIQRAGEFAAAMATLKIEGSGPFCGVEGDVLKLLASRQGTAFVSR